MKLLAAVAVGYVLGTRARREDVDDIVASLRAIRESEEFQDFLTGLRDHAVHGLRDLADFVEAGASTDVKGLEIVDGEGPGHDLSTDLVERVRRLAGLR